MSRGKIVVIGAGIVGCVLTEHLMKLGATDVTVTEKGPLFETGGSSSHAPGLMFQTNSSRSMTKLAMRSVEKYSSLTHEDGPCYIETGSVEVAYTPERLQELKRKLGFAASYGLEGAKLLSPEECAEMIPQLDQGKIYGGYFVPSDGIGKAVRIGAALGQKAQERGAVFHGNAEVLDIEVSDGRVQAVVTSKGRFEADVVVCCAGIWGPKIGKMVGLTLPLQPLEHQMAYTKPLEALSHFKDDETAQPILRHQDSSMYFKQFYDTYGVGSYQHRAMPVAAENIQSLSQAPVMPSVNPFTPEDFEGPWNDAKDLLPPLEQAEIDWGMNGLFSFTQDGMSVFGESSKVKGFWAAEAVWVTHAGGAGECVAEWIMTGKSPIGLREHHIDRFEAHGKSPSYIRQRGSQNFIEVYDIIHPLQPVEEPRPLRVSPFYGQQKELGAFFLESSGWERPQWFEVNKRLDSSFVPKRDNWSAKFWSPIVGAEHRTTRERVALFDMTSLKKVEVSGKNATALLNKLTTGKMNMRVGNVTYTLVLDEAGGVKSDVTVARLDKNLYQLGINSGMDVTHLQEHAAQMGEVHVEDATSKLCCIGIWGPYARDVMQSLSESDFSHEGHGFFKAKEVFIREVPVRALRLSYVGELGYELYTSYEYGYRLWNLLWEAGQAYGIIAGGRGAFDGLRLEKGYRSWGKDMHTEHDPFEAGLGFAVKMDKEDFIGKEALLERKEEGPRQVLTCLTLDDASKVVMGSEPVYGGDEAIGYVTSAAYGYTVGRGIAYAWLPPQLAKEGTSLQIEYFGERFSATVQAEPLFDPEMKRMRAKSVEEAKSNLESDVAVTA